jgi:hypothetical protein
MIERFFDGKRNSVVTGSSAVCGGADRRDVENERKMSGLEKEKHFLIFYF